MIQKRSTLTEGTWSAGIPDGSTVSTREWVQYANDTRFRSGISTTTAFYSNGLAQGDVWTEDREEYQGGTDVLFTKHVVEDGIPVPFEVTISGMKFTVYEAYGTTMNSFQWLDEDKCSCKFIFMN